MSEGLGGKPSQARETTNKQDRPKWPSRATHHKVQRKKKPMNRIITTLAVSVAVGFSAHAQNLILNGSFESPAITANALSYPTVPDSWLGNNVGILNGTYGGIDTLYPLPHSGQQYLHLGSSSFLSQAFTVSSPGKYVLSWFDSTEFNGPDTASPYSVTVSDSAANTVASKNLDANASSLRLWTQHSIELMLASGTYTLRFEGYAAFYGEKADIDDVSVEPSGIQQSCPCGGPVSGGTWKNHGQYVSCVAKAAEAALKHGLVTEGEKDAIVEEAAQSNCGKK